MITTFPFSRNVSTHHVQPAVITRAMVQRRTHELALRAGRIPPQVDQSDYEQAKRELTGESDLERQQAILDAVPAAEDWPKRNHSVDRSCAPASRTEPPPMLYVHGVTA